MQNERLEQLFSMEQLDNQDPLIKYMIALEFKKNDDKRTEQYFDLLLADFPDYLATYYVAGEYFYDVENYQKSAEILQKGLQVAQSQNNTKTYNEIKNLLVNVEMFL
jgi:tetratricopeptide (TPR) repeat protein